MPKKTKKKQKKQSWTVQKYIIVLRNEGNLREYLPFRGKGWQLVALGGVLLALVSAVSMLVSVSFYSFWDSNYSEEAQLRSRVVSLAHHTDSLQSELLYHQHYLRSLWAVFGGDTAYLRETIAYKDVIDSSFVVRSYSYSPDIARSAPVSRSNQMQFPATSPKHEESISVVNRYLFPPIKGYISDNYAENEAHYGIDLLAPQGSTVQATAAGVVIFASWTQDGGYVIALQHEQGLVSFYKHNSELLKQVGEEVYSGAPIAIIGNTGNLSTGPHLHFEIWRDGKPINPERFISFQ